MDSISTLVGLRAGAIELNPLGNEIMLIMRILAIFVVLTGFKGDIGRGKYMVAIPWVIATSNIIQTVLVTNGVWS